MIIVRPVSSEKCTVGAKLPKAPTQKPRIRLTDATVTGAPTARVVRWIAVTASPAYTRR